MNPSGHTSLGLLWARNSSAKGSAKTAKGARRINIDRRKNKFFMYLIFLLFTISAWGKSTTDHITATRVTLAPPTVSAENSVIIAKYLRELEGADSPIIYAHGKGSYYSPTNLRRLDYPYFCKCDADSWDRYDGNETAYKALESAGDGKYKSPVLCVDNGDSSLIKSGTPYCSPIEESGIIEVKKTVAFILLAVYILIF